MEARPIELPAEGLVDGDIRIRLRADADVTALIEAVRDPEIPRWTRVPDDYDEDAASEWAEVAERANAASRGVAERAGFTFEGVLRSYHVLKGRRRDAAIYSLLPGELR